MHDRNIVSFYTFGFPTANHQYSFHDTFWNLTSKVFVLQPAALRICASTQRLFQFIFPVVSFRSSSILCGLLLIVCRSRGISITVISIGHPSINRRILAPFFSILVNRYVLLLQLQKKLECYSALTSKRLSETAVNHVFNCKHLRELFFVHFLA